ncbi:MucBP domain-containing protein [Dellaglioa sp. BT-FLS60]
MELIKIALRDFFRNVLSVFTKPSQPHPTSDIQFTFNSNPTKKIEPSKIKRHEVIENQTFLPTSVSDATMIIYYKDQDDHNLSRPQIISGTKGSDLRIQFDPIPDYHLIGISGFTSTFVASYGAIILSYEKKHGAAVWIYNQDIDGGYLIGPPTLLRGQLHEPFTYDPVNIPGFNLLRASKTSYGNFTNEQQTIYYYYRNLNWRTVDKIDAYIQITERARCFDLPDGNFYPAFLPAGGILQVFEKIETNSGTHWYGMGGNQWLEDTSNVHLIDQPDYTSLTKKEIDKLTKKRINQPALIDYIPDKSVTIYAEPYGKKLRTLADNTQVTLISQLTSPNSIVWFELKNGGFINESYIKIAYSLN